MGQPPDKLQTLTPMDVKTLLRAMARIPVTSAALIFGLVGYLLYKFNLDYSFLEYIPSKPPSKTGEYWRLITPVFIHFDELHVIFNCLWIWELGRRLELYFGRVNYFLIFIALAIASSLGQIYIIAGRDNMIFGGLSGVVYGCLGMLLVARFVERHPVLRIPDGLYFMMIIFMALGFTGVLDILVSGTVANMAHLAGFLMGVFLGCIFFSKQIYKVIVTRYGNK